MSKVIQAAYTNGVFRPVLRKNWIVSFFPHNPLTAGVG